MKKINDYKILKEKYANITYDGKKIEVPEFLEDGEGTKIPITKDYMPICDDYGIDWVLDFGDKYISAYGSIYEKCSCMLVEHLPENILSSVSNSSFEDLKKIVDKVGIDNVYAMLEEIENLEY